jgi:hypothetical protein
MKYIVAFAGPVGSSKTPIALYLSSKFGLPIFNNDAVRTEVIEDLLMVDEEEFTKRRDRRLQDMLKSGQSFILDASGDRQTEEYERNVLKLGYRYFLISLDLGREFLVKLYKAKGYKESLNKVDQYISDHNYFLSKFNDRVSLHITEKEFPDRLTICENALKKWLESDRSI